MSGLKQSFWMWPIGADRSAWFLDPQMAFVNQGTVVEAFVGQELLCYLHPQSKKSLYFWKREKKGSQAAVDYLYEQNGCIFPIEVKSDKGSTLKSMHLFLENHPKSPFGIRFSSLGYSTIEQIDSRPLYAVCSLADEEQREALQALVS